MFHLNLPMKNLRHQVAHRDRMLRKAGAPTDTKPDGYQLICIMTSTKFHVVPSNKELDVLEDDGYVFLWVGRKLGGKSPYLKLAPVPEFKRGNPPFAFQDVSVKKMHKIGSKSADATRCQRFKVGVSFHFHLTISIVVMVSQHFFSDGNKSQGYIDWQVYLKKS